MSAIGKDKLVFDTTTSLDENDNVGAYLRASDGTLITHTTDGAKERLDVTTGAEYAAGSAAGGSDRGMFALAVDNSGNYAPLKVNSSGDLLVAATFNSAADKAEDAAHSSGDVGVYSLAVRADTRPTNANTSANGDYASFFVNVNGELWTHDADALAKLTTIDTSASSIVTSTGTIATNTGTIVTNTGTIATNTGTIATNTGTIASATHAEDAAALNGDVGMYALSVRQDTLASSTSADGDYQSFKTNSVGALWTAISGAVSTTTAAPNTAFLAANETVGTSAAALIASPLANRKKLMIQNLGKAAIFVGDSSVSVTNGLKISAGANWEVDAGPALSIYAVSGSAGMDVRVLEIA